MDIVLVGVGGFVGAQARYGISTLVARRFGTAFPFGTFIINVTGSFILGLFVTLAARAIFVDQAYHFLIAVGFCGGYTTFSTYTYETLTLLREGNVTRGWVANLIGSFLTGLAGALSGIGLGNIL